MKECQFKKYKRIYSRIFWTLSFIFLTGACGGGKANVPSGLPTKVSRKELALMGYTIQIGAFSNLNNAIRLTLALEKSGLDPYYFVHPTGLYKVRFGEFSLGEVAPYVLKNSPCRVILYQSSYTEPSTPYLTE